MMMKTKTTITRKTKKTKNKILKIKKEMGRKTLQKIKPAKRPKLMKSEAQKTD